MINNNDDPVLGSDPEDGYRVTSQTFGEHSWLQLMLYAGGEPVTGFGGEAFSTELYAWVNPTEEEAGAKERLRHVLAGVARFLNVGGNWVQLDAALAVFRASAPGTRDLGPYYYAGQEDREEAVCHIFVRRDADDQAVLWCEGESVNAYRLAPETGILTPEGSDGFEEGGDEPPPQRGLPQPPAPG